MGMGGRMAIPTEAFHDGTILTLTQWFSPAYPVGAFAYSHGMEWSIDSGAVTDTASAQDWITAALRDGAGWNDALFLAAAFRADTPEALQDVDATCRAFAASRERAQEADLMGRAFGQVTADLWGGDLRGLAYPVAIGAAARTADLPLALTTQMYLQGFVANLAAVAMRLVPLGQTDGQRIIRDLTPVCTELADAAQDASLDNLSATAFGTDIAAMKHETQYSRIFRT